MDITKQELRWRLLNIMGKVMNFDADEILSNLPGNDREALREIAHRIKKQEKLIDNENDKYVHDRLAIHLVTAWCKQHQIAITMRTGDNIGETYEALFDEIESLELKILENEIERKVREASAGQLMTFGFARLDRTEKEEIHLSLNNVRKIIEKSKLDDKKKNAIFNKLNALARGVDQSGTKTDAFFGLIGDFGVQLGQFGQDAKPLMQEVRSMLEVILRSRARAEDTALPKTAEILLPKGSDEEADES